MLGFPWFGRKAKAAEEAWKAELSAMFKRERCLADAGWNSFVNPAPGSPSPAGQMIDIIGSDGTIHTLEYRDLPPWANVAGKFWRPSIFSSSGKTIEGELTPAITERMIPLN